MKNPISPILKSCVRSISIYLQDKEILLIQNEKRPSKKAY